jgi:hypothetical protein
MLFLVRISHVQFVVRHQQGLYFLTFGLTLLLVVELKESLLHFFILIFLHHLFEFLKLKLMFRKGLASLSRFIILLCCLRISRTSRLFFSLEDISQLYKLAFLSFNCFIVRRFVA